MSRLLALVPVGFVIVGLVWTVVACVVVGARSDERLAEFWFPPRERP